MAQGIYLDNNTTTRPSEKAISKMLPFLTENWGSPSSPHQFGQQVVPAMGEAYRLIYALMGAKESDSIILTSSAAEGVNQVILSSYFDITRHTGKNQYITSTMDEAPAIMAIGRLEQLGCVGKMVNGNAHGQITAEIIADAISPRTALVSLSWANGLTGVINPVGEIASLCAERGIKLHLDATHVLGKLFFDLEDVGAHFITFSGDHFHAPKGTGGLYIKNGTKCSPLILGGVEQGGFRAGGVDVPGLVALGQASAEAIDSRDLVCTEIARLRNHFEEGILQQVAGARVFFRECERLPHCTAIGFPGVPNEALLYALNRRGVYASIGGGSFQQIGLVLMACGIDEITAHTALNFSLSRQSNEEEIEKAVEIVADCVKKLHKVSSKTFPTA